MSDGGKGSGRRQSNVPRSVVDDNWDRIFGKKKAAEQPQEAKDVAVLRRRLAGGYRQK